MPKNIVVYSDGTGQDGGARPEQRVSNIYKMYRASRDHADTAVDPSQQVVFYDAGLGTDIGSTALTAPGRFVQKLLGSVTGAGLQRNIAARYFIGVFDTVAALGASGMRYLLIQAGLAIGVSVAAFIGGFVPAVVIAALSTWIFGSGFLVVGFVLQVLIVAVANGIFWYW